MSESRYRVRDRNTASGPGKVWGDNLSLQEATALKERVVTSRKSKTARVEEMSQSDDALGNLQAGAKAAAQQAAAAANERHRTTVTAIAELGQRHPERDEVSWLTDNELDDIMKMIPDVDQDGIEVDQFLESEHPHGSSSGDQADAELQPEPIRKD